MVYRALRFPVLSLRPFIGFRVLRVFGDYPPTGFYLQQARFFLVVMFGEATPCLGKPHPQPKTRNRKTRTRNRLRGLTFKPQYLHLSIPNSRFEPLYQPFQASQMSNPFRNPVSKQSSIRGGGNNAVDTTRTAHPCLLRAGDLAWPYRDQGLFMVLFILRRGCQPCLVPL